MGIITGSFNLSLLEKGSKGAKIRTRVWTEGDTHLEGKEGEDFYDVVRYEENNQLYLCIKTVGAAAKKGVNDPVTSIQKHLGFWAVAQNWEFVATKLLLAEKITADMINADGIKANNVDITGKITATSGDISNVTVDTIESRNGNFSIDYWGNATVNGLTSTGGTFDQLTATDGTFTRGTFTDITSTNGSFTDMTATGGTFTNIVATGGTFTGITATDITSTRGSFTDMTATGGTFTNITAKGGTFNNITSDGGTFTNVDVTGKITATSGSIDNVTVSNISSKNNTFTIDAAGNASVNNLTAVGGTFTDITANNITVNSGTFKGEILLGDGITKLSSNGDAYFGKAGNNNPIFQVTGTYGRFGDDIYVHSSEISTQPTEGVIENDGYTHFELRKNYFFYTDGTNSLKICPKYIHEAGSLPFEGVLTISANSYAKDRAIYVKSGNCLFNNDVEVKGSLILASNQSFHGVKGKVHFMSSGGTIADDDDVVIFNNSSQITVNLPSVYNNAGRVIFFKRRGDGGVTVEGSMMRADYKRYISQLSIGEWTGAFFCDGTYWIQSYLG